MDWPEPVRSCSSLCSSPTVSAGATRNFIGSREDLMLPARSSPLRSGSIFSFLKNVWERREPSAWPLPRTPLSGWRVPRSPLPSSSTEKSSQHRQWITRSVVVGPGVFLAVRAIIGITGWEKLGGVAIETVVWVCLAASFFLADLVLQWEELWRSRPAPRKAVVAAS